MSPDQILNAVTKYTAVLQTLGYKAVKADTSALNSAYNKLCHTMWMCEQVHGFVGLGQLEKADRWLGFIQDVLWSYDIQSVDQMREDNRGPT